MSVCPAVCPHLHNNHVQYVTLSCIEEFWNNLAQMSISFCRVQEPRPFLKGQWHFYMLKVHAITIKDYRYNTTKSNIKQ
jgi:hypothetical protein